MPPKLVTEEVIRSREALRNLFQNYGLGSFRDRPDFDHWLDRSLIASVAQEFFLHSVSAGSAGQVNVYIEIKEPWVPLAHALMNMQSELEYDEAAAIARASLDSRPPGVGQAG